MPNRALVDNLIWFLGSLGLAFIVWMVATMQSDPIQQQRFPERIDVQMTPDEGLLITAPTARTAAVVVRAPKSVMDLLSSDEIEVTANLAGLGPGTHSVELQYHVARQATIVDISPRIMRVTLEKADSRQVPLRALVSAEPPAGYSRDEPTFDINLMQVRASGPASRVEQVVYAQVDLNLAQQRSPLSTDMRLTPVDADGVTVPDVTLEPQIVHVNVNIRRRDDVREVSVRPNIQGTPPAGYVLNALSYEPQAVLISGTPEQLARLPATLTTQPIDLSEHTASFDVSVPVVLPEEGLILFSPQNINVNVEIKPLTTSRQFDSIPVEVVGADENSGARLAPSNVAVLVTGPQPALQALRPQDIQVTVDVGSLAPGEHTVTPSITIDPAKLVPTDISVLPAEIDVQITAQTAEPS
jgi:YbbR domain-containing protein